VTAAAGVQVRARAEGLAAALPLAAALASGALRPRHREALAAAAGCDLRPDEPGCTLRRLLEAGAVARQQARSALCQADSLPFRAQAAWGWCELSDGMHTMPGAASPRTWLKHGAIFNLHLSAAQSQFLHASSFGLVWLLRVQCAACLHTLAHSPCNVPQRSTYGADARRRCWQWCRPRSGRPRWRRPWRRPPPPGASVACS